MNDIVTPNQYFDDIFCINLNRRPDRWEKMQKRFIREGLHVTRWTATDAESKEVRVDYTLLNREKPNSGIKNCPGYAILLTYLKLFIHIKKQGFKKVLIFEDDATFHASFTGMFTLAINNIPDDWEMWSLGVSQYGLDNLKFTDDCWFFNPTPPNKSYGLFAFAIKDVYIDTAISFLQARMSYADTDIYAHTYDGKSRVYISCPPLCSHEPGFSDNKNMVRTTPNVLEYCPCDLNKPILTTSVYR